MDKIEYLQECLAEQAALLEVQSRKIVQLEDRIDALQTYLQNGWDI